MLTALTVPVQQEEFKLWIHGTMVEHGTEEGHRPDSHHQDKETQEVHPISVKEYLRNEMSKNNRTQNNDKLS